MVTIIVLLILAGTTITTVFGDNGIVTKAQQASQATKKAEVIEGIQIDILTASFDGDITESELNTILSKYGTVGTDADDNVILTVEDIGDIDITDIYTSALGRGTGATTLASQITVANYGDYVEYSVDLNDDGDYTNDWKVFYNDGEHVFIIASDYLNVNLLPASTGMTTDATSSIYNARWDNPDGYADFGNSTILSLFKFSYTGAFNEGYYSHQVCAGLLDTSNWSGFVDSSYASYAIGGPTIEMWKASWDAVYEDEKFTLTEDNYGYLVNGGAYSADLSGSDGYDNTLYFPYQAAVESCYGYWLASPGTGDLNPLVVDSFGTLKAMEYLFYGHYNLGLRPVVCLNSDVLGTSTDNGGVTTWSLSSGA